MSAGNSSKSDSASDGTYQTRQLSWGKAVLLGLESRWRKVSFSVWLALLVISTFQPLKCKTGQVCDITHLNRGTQDLVEIEKSAGQTPVPDGIFLMSDRRTPNCLNTTACVAAAPFSSSWVPLQLSPCSCTPVCLSSTSLVNSQSANYISRRNLHFIRICLFSEESFELGLDLITSGKGRPTDLQFMTDQFDMKANARELNVSSGLVFGNFWQLSAKFSRQKLQLT